MSRPGEIRRLIDSVLSGGELWRSLLHGCVLVSVSHRKLVFGSLTVENGTNQTLLSAMAHVWRLTQGGSVFDNIWVGVAYGLYSAPAPWVLPSHELRHVRKSDRHRGMFDQIVPLPQSQIAIQTGPD